MRKELTSPSENEPLPRMALGITAETGSSSSEEMCASSGTIAATDFPLAETVAVDFFGALPAASRVAVTFL
jgi:hypothetical protein